MLHAVGNAVKWAIERRISWTMRARSFEEEVAPDAIYRRWEPTTGTDLNVLHTEMVLCTLSVPGIVCEKFKVVFRLSGDYITLDGSCAFLF